MGAHKFGGDGKAQPRAPLSCSTLKGFKQLVANLIRNAGAIVTDLDYGHAAFAPCLQGNGAIGPVRPFGLGGLDGLDGVAHKIGQYTD